VAVELRVGTSDAKGLKKLGAYLRGGQWYMDVGGEPIRVNGGPAEIKRIEAVLYHLNGHDVIRLGADDVVAIAITGIVSSPEVRREIEKFLEEN
jgi:hypothetical protein